MSRSSSNKENKMVKKSKKKSEPQEGQINPWFCELCKKSYKLKYSLNRHRKFVCGVCPQFQCEICKRAFNMRYDLKVHCRAKHNLELGGEGVAKISIPRNSATLADLQNVNNVSHVFIGHDMDAR
ncbi:hypothetical protein HUJ05_009028 [Dendroctonus ponderosae]|nr:hypothetical protein HUJ05_009028 [Dendroctonus ponderosae]